MVVECCCPRGRWKGVENKAAAFRHILVAAYSSVLVYLVWLVGRTSWDGSGAGNFCCGWMDSFGGAAAQFVAVADVTGGGLEMYFEFYSKLIVELIKNKSFHLIFPKV